MLRSGVGAGIRLTAPAIYHPLSTIHFLPSPPPSASCSNPPPSGISSPAIYNPPPATHLPSPTIRHPPHLGCRLPAVIRHPPHLSRRLPSATRLTSPVVYLPPSTTASPLRFLPSTIHHPPPASPLPPPAIHHMPPPSHRAPVAARGARQGGALEYSLARHSQRRLQQPTPIRRQEVVGTTFVTWQYQR